MASVWVLSDPLSDKVDKAGWFDVFSEAADAIIGFELIWVSISLATRLAAIPCFLAVDSLFLEIAIWVSESVFERLTKSIADVIVWDEAVAKSVGFSAFTICSVLGRLGRYESGVISMSTVWVCSNLLLLLLFLATKMLRLAETELLPILFNRFSSATLMPVSAAIVLKLVLSAVE